MVRACYTSPEHQLMKMFVSQCLPPKLHVLAMRLFLVLNNCLVQQTPCRAHTTPSTWPSAKKGGKPISPFTKTQKQGRTCYPRSHNPTNHITAPGFCHSQRVPSVSGSDWKVLSRCGSMTHFSALDSTHG